ncbi:DUF5753 domain-containing protein [Saccharopolyspora shandongensis]|uniref:DUF5753 domain-containing protein n=1 Tax=Saccharopolyspora shandongensis TaxID=418495 RepID=UPI0033C51557
MFPALVQSPAYVEALMELSQGIWWDEAADQERLDRVAIRLERQRRAFESEKDKEVHLLFTDDAVVGSSEVMREQVAYILSMVDAQPRLTVQVVPAAARNSPAQHGGLTLFGFGEVLRTVGSLPVVYGPATYFDKEPDTRCLERAFGKLCELALSPSETVDFMRRKLQKGS